MEDFRRWWVLSPLAGRWPRIVLSDRRRQNHGGAGDYGCDLSGGLAASTIYDQLRREGHARQLRGYRRWPTFPYDESAPDRLLGRDDRFQLDKGRSSLTKMLCPSRVGPLRVGWLGRKSILACTLNIGDSIDGPGACAGPPRHHSATFN